MYSLGNLFGSVKEQTTSNQKLININKKEIDQCKNNQKSTELDLKTVKDTNAKLYESVVDLKARSMRDNLIFTGIPEQRWEDTEQVLQNFSRISTSLITESILKGYTG